MSADRDKLIEVLKLSEEIDNYNLCIYTYESYVRNMSELYERGMNDDTLKPIIDHINEMENELDIIVDKRKKILSEM